MALPGGNTVTLRGVPVPLENEIGQAFIADCVRNIEGLITDIDVKAKWGLTDEMWVALSENTPLIDAVRSERERRIMTGAAAAEAAHLHYANAPVILGGILTNEDISPRHRIEAARELRAVAATSQRDRLTQPDKIIITINLGADENLVYEKEGLPPRNIHDGALD